MNLFIRVQMLSIDGIFLIAALFEEFNGDLAELGVGQHVIRLPLDVYKRQHQRRADLEI